MLEYLLIWCLLFVVLKYDLKQNTINSIVRSTCFTLLSYVMLECKYKEYFSSRHRKSSSDKTSSSTDNNSEGTITIPDATTIQDNLITTQVKSYKKKKNMCDYVKDQQRLTVNALHQNLKEIQNSTSITDSQIGLVQSNFDDLIAVKQAGDSCDS